MNEIDKSEVTILDSEAQPTDLKKGVRYLADVNNIEQYGVFVNLTPNWGSDLSGLVHASNLPPLTQPRDYSKGDSCVVSVNEFKEDGDLSFKMHYAEGVSTGANGEIPEKATSQVEGDIESLKSEVKALKGKVKEFEEDVVSSGGSSGPVSEIASKVEELAEDGYSAEEYTKAVRDNGKEVELRIKMVVEDE